MIFGILGHQRTMHLLLSGNVRGKNHLLALSDQLPD